jgi:hypothetical protein
MESGYDLNLFISLFIFLIILLLKHMNKTTLIPKLMKHVYCDGYGGP